MICGIIVRALVTQQPRPIEMLGTWHEAWKRHKSVSNHSHGKHESRDCKCQVIVHFMKCLFDLSVHRFQLFHSSSKVMDSWCLKLETSRPPVVFPVAQVAQRKNCRWEKLWGKCRCHGKVGVNGRRQGVSWVEYWDYAGPTVTRLNWKPAKVGIDFFPHVEIARVWCVSMFFAWCFKRVSFDSSLLQAQVVHQVMPQNNQMTMQNVHRPSAQMGGAGAGSHAPHPQAHAQAQAAHTAPAAHAAPFPALPVNLSRQHLPDREPGSFTPPAAGVGSFVPRMGESTPTSRAKSPEVIQAQAAQAIGPHGMMMPRGGLVKSPPRMPGPKSSLGALPGSARNTPKPQSRQVVSFAPMGRSPSPNRQQDRSPSPESRQIRDGDRCDRRRETWQDRDRRLSRSEDSIPEEPPRVDQDRQDRLADRDRVAKWERDLLILQEKLRVREHKVAEREADLVAREKRVADREADLAKMFDRLTEREEHHRQDSQVRANDLASQKDKVWTKTCICLNFSRGDIKKMKSKQRQEKRKHVHEMIIILTYCTWHDSWIQNDLKQPDHTLGKGCCIAIECIFLSSCTVVHDNKK